MKFSRQDRMLLFEEFLNYGNLGYLTLNYEGELCWEFKTEDEEMLFRIEVKTGLYSEYYTQSGSYSFNHENESVDNDYYDRCYLIPHIMKFIKKNLSNYDPEHCELSDKVLFLLGKIYLEFEIQPDEHGILLE